MNPYHYFHLIGTIPQKGEAENGQAQAYYSGFTGGVIPSEAAGRMSQTEANYIIYSEIANLCVYIYMYIDR